MAVESEVVYVCKYVCVCGVSVMLLAPGAIARVQDGIPTSCMDTVDFVLLAHEGPEIWAH